MQQAVEHGDDEGGDEGREHEAVKVHWVLVVVPAVRWCGDAVCGAVCAVVGGGERGSRAGRACNKPHRTPAAAAVVAPVQHEVPLDALGGLGVKVEQATAGAEWGGGWGGVCDRTGVR